ncbi:hypothetical protein PTKIN_Ptkin14bG0100200 [Pterospermum kingtungense]
MDFLLNKFAESWDTQTNLVEKMDGLKRKLQGLNARKEDTESSASTELRPSKKLKKEVEDVLKKIQEVEEPFQQDLFHDSLVVDDPGWIGQVLPTTVAFGGAPRTCMEEIWACLMDDDIHKVGVWGMGGVGKTTIMKLIHNQLLKETEKFNIVLWITVSKEKNTFKMQKRIARAMKETLDKDEDETIRAGMINEMLARKGKYVLILDDLWEKLSLEEVGIPEPSNGSKILVTTRLLDVCRYLDCREVKLHTLSEPDAWGLFLKNVGEDILNHPDILLIVKSVAEECDGLPLAIVTIASCMKGIRDIHEWRNALHELKRQVKSVNGMEEKVFRQLQFSYDRLPDEKVKHCFLYCAFYPESYKIRANELIQHWIAEGLVEEMDSLEMEISRGYAILNKLRNSCLVEYNITNQVKVKLHDVVRDMALRITSVNSRFLVRAGKKTGDKQSYVPDWKEDLEKASLMWNSQLRIPHQMPPPKCPSLTTLWLSHCNIRSIPEGFFEQMHGLKIFDLSGNYHIKSLPNSISNLESLTTLLLCACTRLEKVPSLSKLEALKKLDLGWTGIKEIPDGMEKLVNIKHLDLSETLITEIDDGILTKFKSLQHLGLITFWAKRGIPVRGKVIGGLTKLEIFEGRFDDLNELNNYGQALLNRKCWPHEYRISTSPTTNEDFKWWWDRLIILDGGNICFSHGIKIPCDVEYLDIKNVNKEEEEWEEEEEALFSWIIIPVPLNIFSSLFEIRISKCKNIKKLLSSIWVLQNLQNLEYLCVEDCHEMEEIIASDLELKVEEEGTRSTTTASFKSITLPKLRQLELYDLPELKSICGANGVMVCDLLRRLPL